MKFQKQTALTILSLMISLTTSRAMDILLQHQTDHSMEEIVNDPARNPLNGPFNAFMIHHINDHTSDSISNPIDQLPISATDHTFYAIDDSAGEIPIPEDFDTVMTYENVDYASDNLTYGSMDDLVTHSVDEPEVIYIPAQPKIFTMHVQEFHECVSCSADDGARRYYEQCLQELSPKHQEVIKSCCNISFDSDFCSNAASGKIDYKTICQDPEKALKVGDCFWLKTEDKDADDIRKYRECKKQILDRYCTFKSSSDNDLVAKEKVTGLN